MHWAEVKVPVAGLLDHCRLPLRVAVDTAIAEHVSGCPMTNELPATGLHELIVVITVAARA